MEWLLIGLLGWCGNDILRFRPPRGTGGGGFDPDNPWPPNCIVCGGLIGALTALLVLPVLNASIASAGFAGVVVASLAAGRVGGDIVGNIVGLIRG